MQMTRDVPEEQRKEREDGTKGPEKIFATQFWIGIKFQEGVGMHVPYAHVRTVPALLIILRSVQQAR